MAVRAQSISVVLLLLCSIAFVVCSSELEEGLIAQPHIVVREGPQDAAILSARRRTTVYGTSLSPDQLKDIYNMDLDPTAGAGKTIAIIDAFAHPTIESDLATFSNYYGLPPCTTSNGCFKRVSQTGSTTVYPPTTNDTGWAQEASMDVQWAHAFAPGAKILYIETNSALYTDLMTGVQYASRNADYVSMSFGGAEFGGSTYETIFTASGVSFFASSGDTGAGVNYPAASPHVVAVGGTTLYVSSTTETLVTENGWSGSGGGCSQYYTASTSQLPVTYATCGTKRAIPDVAYNANPSSGVLVYVSEGCPSPPSCWYTIGGTSLAAPLVAARSAVRGVVVNQAFVYGNNIVFRDITSGNNGYACKTGYDQVTGMGSWVGDVGATTATSSATTPSTTSTTRGGTTATTATTGATTATTATSAKTASSTTTSTTKKSSTTTSKATTASTTTSKSTTTSTTKSATTSTTATTSTSTSTSTSSASTSASTASSTATAAASSATTATTGNSGTSTARASTTTTAATTGNSDDTSTSATDSTTTDSTSTASSSGTTTTASGTTGRTSTTTTTKQSTTAAAALATATAALTSTSTSSQAAGSTTQTATTTAAPTTTATASTTDSTTGGRKLFQFWSAAPSTSPLSVLLTLLVALVLVNFM